MPDEVLKRDQNFVTVLAGVTNDSDQDITMLRVDSITKRLLVTASGIISNANFIDNEIVAGSGTTWVLSHTPIDGTVHLYGQRNRLYPITITYPENDFSISGATITTTLNFQAGDILADYRIL